jgi:hypothetical protein
MVDFAEIDRQLAALGKVPQDLAALIARELGEHAARERRDELLAELSAGTFVPEQRAPVPLPSRPAPARDSALERAVIAPPAPVPNMDTAPELQAAAPALTDAPEEGDEPELSFSQQTASEEPGGYFRDAVESEPVRGSSLPSARRSWSWPGSSRESSRPPRPSWPPTGVSKSSPAEHEAPTALTPMAELPPVAAERAELDALLEQDLDPSDFPRTEPPPSTLAAEQAAAPESEDDFEMLIEDDEIIELDDNELEDVD